VAKLVSSSVLRLTSFHADTGIYTVQRFTFSFFYIMYITAIDLGSANTKAVIAEQRKDGSLSLVKTIRRESKGIKKGEIVYPEETVKSLFEVLSSVRQFDKKCLRNIVFGISGTRVQFHLSRAAISIPRPDFEILHEDVDRVVQESMAIQIPAGWQIIHSFPREFVIDGMEVEGTDVVGLSGKKLEANVVLISAFSSVYRNFRRVTDLVLGKKSEFSGVAVFTPLASDRAVLTKSQRELGVVVLDIGYGTTGMVVYQDGRLLLAKVLPVGSGHITNDLAVGLRCTVPTAELVKCEYGCASARDVSVKDKIDLSQYEPELSPQTSLKFVAEIIEARVRELFELVEDELKALGVFGKLPAGAVLVGGGAKLKGIADIAREELKSPVKIGYPNLDEFERGNSGVSETDDPSMAAACGLVLQQSDRMRKHSGIRAFVQQPFGAGEGWFKRMVRTLLASE
jgi:cell division protein FtsA